MRVRDSIALTLPSLFLRLVLGVTFLWAGTGKLLGTMQVSGEDAARLANLGVNLEPVPMVEPASSDQPANEPIDPLPEASPTDVIDEVLDQAQESIDNISDTLEETTSDPPTEAPAVDEPETDPATEPVIDEPTIEESIGLQPNSAYTWTRVQNTASDRTASDFPEPVQCQRVYSIALMISKAADPGLTADSQPITPIMPTKFADAPWPKILAWSAAITELVAGVFLVFGLLTRISAISTFFVMLVAMWMTQIGPAALHSADAILGFIPNNQPWYNPGSYSALLWQLAVAGMSLSVVFLGSGAIGLDRLIFSSNSRDPYLHGDPKAKKKGSDPATAQRTEFDRSPSSD